MRCLFNRLIDEDWINVKKVDEQIKLLDLHYWKSFVRRQFLTEILLSSLMKVD